MSVTVLKELLLGISGTLASFSEIRLLNCCSYVSPIWGAKLEFNAYFLKLRKILMLEIHFLILEIHFLILGGQ